MYVYIYTCIFLSMYVYISIQVDTPKMGPVMHHRGFSDENLWMAQTTDTKVAGVTMKGCSGNPATHSYSRIKWRNKEDSDTCERAFGPISFFVTQYPKLFITSFELVIATFIKLVITKFGQLHFTPLNT